ncbi:MAG TPA: alpha/beta-type small acid-soluble spore protein [Bacillota bacterium]|nr:alpha/beta-type small acid-soluble spore protein [Bacillota bacterium]
MGTGQKRNNYVVLEAGKALDKFKWEVAKEINIDTAPIQGGYWGYMTARDCGAVGGHMVKRMIEAAEQTLASQAATQVTGAFRQTLSSSAQPQNFSQSNFNLNQ